MYFSKFIKKNVPIPTDGKETVNKMKISQSIAR